MRFKILKVREASGESVISPDAVATIMKKEARADRECFWVLHLNGRNRIIEKELVSIGSATSAIVHPRETFKMAILNGSANIITVHNHPSGDPTPSSNDNEIWERLDKAGEILGITVLDHVIITPCSIYYSRKEGKLISLNKRKEVKDNGKEG